MYRTGVGSACELGGDLNPVGVLVRSHLPNGIQEDFLMQRQLGPLCSINTGNIREFYRPITASSWTLINFTTLIRCKPAVLQRKGKLTKSCARAPSRDCPVTSLSVQ